MKIKQVYINIFNTRVATFDCLFPSKYYELKTIFKTQPKLFCIRSFSQF